MSIQSHYYRIGVFVIIATGLCIAGIAILGAQALFRKGFVIETYLDESVQGLDVGAQIKYRGVQIGHVDEITFVRQIYATAKPYVLIRGTIDSDTFATSTEDSLQRILQAEIEKGLRVRWNAQGITGAAYLEVDYLPPDRTPQLEIDWIPEVAYIPSSLSAMSQLTRAVEDVARQVEGVDLITFLQDANDLILYTSSTLETLQIVELRKAALQTLDSLEGNFQSITDSVNRLEKQAGEQLDHVQSEGRLALATARQVVNDVGDKINRSLEHFDLATSEVTAALRDVRGRIQDPRVSQNLENVTQMTEHLTSATEDLPTLLARLNLLIRHLDSMITTERVRVGRIVDDLERFSQNLADITDTARQYPGYFLWGNAPKPLEMQNVKD